MRLSRPPRRHALLAAVLLVALVALGLAPALAGPLPQQSGFGYSRMGLPLIAVARQDSLQPSNNRSRIVAWLDIPGQVPLNRRLQVVVNIKNEGPNTQDARTRVIIPYDGRKFEAVDSSFDGSRGDWVRENRFPTDLTVEFGALRAGETRRGVLFFQLREVRAGDRMRVRGRHSNGQVACGQVECQMNERQVEVIPAVDGDALGTLPPGSRVVQKLGDIAYGTRRTWAPEGFRPNEQVVTWLNLPAGGQRPLTLQQRADVAGRVFFSIDVSGLANGFYSIVAHGSDTRTEIVGEFQVIGSPVLAGAALAAPALIPLPAPAAPAEVAAAPLAAAPAQTGGNAVLIGAVAAAGTSGATRLEGVQVNVVAADGTVAGAAPTDRYGGYVIGGLAAGSYTVTFDPHLSFSETVRRYQPHTVTSFSVPASGSTSLDAELALGSSISGQITGAGAGALEGVSVVLLSGGNLVEATTTGADGRYRLDGVPPGSYTLQLDPLTSADEAVRAFAGETLPPFTVLARTPLSGKSKALSRAATTGEIAGQVVAADSGAPLGDAYVIFERLNAATSAYEYAGLAQTDEAGAYSGVLPPGTYRVSFQPGLSANAATAAYLGAYFGSAGGGPVGATSIVLAGSGTEYADVALTRGGTIGGTVTGGGKPLADVAVLVSTGGQLVDVALTDETGAYHTSGLPAGSYTLEFVTALTDNAATRAYAGATRAQPVAVAGSAVSGVDAALTQGGAFAGAVTGEGGAGLANVLVLAVNTRGTATADDDTLGGLALTGATGTYTLTGLPAGSYLVAFITGLTGDAEVVAYFDEYYDDATQRAQADAVSVAAGATTPGISAALTRGGQIRGRVTDAANGRGLPGVLVTVYSTPAPGSLVAFAVTDERGDYATSALATGASYRVRFDPLFGGGQAAYAAEYYNDRPDEAGATAVSVASTAPVTGIDAGLAAAP